MTADRLKVAALPESRQPADIMVSPDIAVVRVGERTALVLPKWLSREQTAKLCADLADLLDDWPVPDADLDGLPGDDGVPHVVNVTQLGAPSEFVAGPFDSAEVASEWAKANGTQAWTRVQIVPPVTM